MNYNYSNVNQYTKESLRNHSKNDYKERVKVFLIKLNKYLYGDLTSEIKLEFGIFNGACIYGDKIGLKAEALYSELIGLVSKYVYITKAGLADDYQNISEIEKDIFKANKLRKNLNVLIKKSRIKFAVEEVDLML